MTKPLDWRERPVLVTGATGIVGSWLCEALIERGARVVALVLDDDPASRFYTEAIDRRTNVVRGDLSRIEDCARAINLHDVEIIFHLGAQTIVGTALRDPLECFESNIRGTYNLLESVRRLGDLVKATVIASSDKAYGDSPILPYTEDMPLNGKHPYDVSKSCTDLLAQTYANTYGTRVSIARCGNIYGGGDLNWSRIVPGTIRSLLLGDTPILRSDGGPIRDYIYVRDVVDAYLTLAEATLTGAHTGEAYNFSPESRWTVLQIVEAIGRVMNVDATPTIVASAHAEIRNQTLDATKARQRLNWTPHWSLERGLHETVEWYRGHLAKLPMKATT
ncbi:MAG: GDP-mannose 4,6-dehydratase [Candidatus Velthaea sp.]